MAWLEYGGRLRKLPDGVSVLGSGSDAGLSVDDADLMPRHLIVHPHADHVEVSAFSPDVVVVVGDRQVGAEPCRAAYGAPIRAGSAEFRVWREQPAHRETHPAPARQVAFLVDEHAGAAYPLDRVSTTIGRASSNVIRLSDPTASRFHAQVRREAGGFALHVIGSAGGTVNGRRVSGPRLLGEGDVVEMAFTTLRFTSGPVPDGVEVIPPPPPASFRSERPTMARERISLGVPTVGMPPRIARTAVVIGVALVLGAIALALATL